MDRQCSFGTHTQIRITALAVCKIFRPARLESLSERALAAYPGVQRTGTLGTIALDQNWNFCSYVALNSFYRRTTSQTDNGGDHMSRRLSAVALFVCCIVTITASAQSQQQSSTRAQGIVLEISIVETTGAQVNEIEMIEATRDQINRMIADGRARLTARLQVRTRTGESFSARVGERIPIQTATLPAIRTTDRPSRDAREPLQSQGASVGVQQIAYENTGLIVEGMSTAAGDGLLDIRLKIEMTGLDNSTGNLTPTFTQRTFSDVVRMKESETAMLMGFIRPAGRKLSLEQIASGTPNPAGGGFVVLLTTKPVQ